MDVCLLKAKNMLTVLKKTKINSFLCKLNKKFRLSEIAKKEKQFLKMVENKSIYATIFPQPKKLQEFFSSIK
jgi:hypothetical protein